MLRLKTLSVIIIFVIFISMTTSVSYADTTSDDQKESAEYLKEFSILTGWAEGDLKYQQGNYQMIPLHLQIGFDITSLLNSINLEPKGRLKFLFEPFLNPILNPSSNIEVGNNFLIKYVHPITQKVSFYFEGGLGLLYTTQHTAEQGMQFNFSQQAGVGFSYLFSENKAFNLSYRFRHYSNADMEEPNSGIDMDYVLCGITVFY